VDAVARSAVSVQRVSLAALFRVPLFFGGFFLWGAAGV